MIFVLSQACLGLVTNELSFADANGEVQSINYTYDRDLAFCLANKECIVAMEPGACNMECQSQTNNDSAQCVNTTIIKKGQNGSRNQTMYFCNNTELNPQNSQTDRCKITNYGSNTTYEFQCDFMTCMMTEECQTYSDKKKCTPRCQTQCLDTFFTNATMFYCDKTVSQYALRVSLVMGIVVCSLVGLILAFGIVFCLASICMGRRGREAAAALGETRRLTQKADTAADRNFM